MTPDRARSMLAELQDNPPAGLTSVAGHDIEDGRCCWCGAAS